MLAREVTTLVHGADQVARAERASSVLFGEDIATLPVDDVLAVFEDVPSTELAGERFGGEGIGAGRSGGARAAGAVEERGAAAGAGRRRVCEQPARADPQARLTLERGDWRTRCSCCGRGRSRITLVRLT